MSMMPHGVLNVRATGTGVAFGGFSASGDVAGDAAGVTSLLVASRANRPASAAPAARDPRAAVPRAPRQLGPLRGLDASGRAIRRAWPRPQAQRPGMSGEVGAGGAAGERARCGPAPRRRPSGDDRDRASAGEDASYGGDLGRRRRRRQRVEHGHPSVNPPARAPAWRRAAVARRRAPPAVAVVDVVGGSRDGPRLRPPPPLRRFVSRWSYTGARWRGRRGRAATAARRRARCWTRSRRGRWGRRRSR